MKYTDEYYDDLVNGQYVIRNLDQFKNSSILITGAGGMICSCLIDFLMQYNKTCEANIQIYAAARSLAKIKKRFGEKIYDKNFHFLEYDATLPLAYNQEFDYIIHGASNANPTVYINQPVETMLANIIGIKNVLDYADKFHVKRVLYISSSEVYGNKATSIPYKEKDYSYVDILNPRACYPSSKRASETLCISYIKEYNVDSVIVRPGHIYGPTMIESDTRASSQFPKNILEGKDIIMKSEGKQIRSYCYVLDCVTAICCVLINGICGEAYNISNRNSIITIRQMAEWFAEIGNKKVVFQLPSEKDVAGYNIMDNSSLSAEMLEDLGWRGIFDIRKGVERTLQCAEI